MKNKLCIVSLTILSVVTFCCNQTGKTPEAPAQRPEKINVNPSGTYLSPEESMKRIFLPQGYHLELVASEPMVEQPVAIAWDGNGRMYVAEMRSYMLDVDGTNEDLPTSRIMRLEDTDGDGKMDKSTVFIDSLVLPRMILTLDDRLVVNETYSNNLWSYRDTDGDGIADEKKLMYQNDARDGRNLEHQKSGLLWNMDNWIYVSADPVRYRLAGDQLVADTFRQSPGGQWGIARDDYGRLYFSSAGGEVPALNFQQNPVYGRVDMKGELADDFNAVWPVTGTPDVQGGAMRVRPDSTLNHFTASNGQSVFRGDRLPQSMHGDLFICEPVGRLIRRAKVTDEEGKIVLKNAYDQAEFLASTDMNFRPVNTITGPDGCLYIVDMYHGIIQESNWTREGSYLRPRIQRMGLDKNIERGRIYRLVHDDYTPGPAPRMLEQSPGQLVSYLDHPNGWWRDEAQKLIIIKGDRSVIPALKKMALGEQSFWDKLLFWKKQPSAIGQIHALWTLEGLNAINEDILSQAFKDKDPQVRKAAIWISEAYLKKDDPQVLQDLAPLVKDTSADVKIQLALSLRYSHSPKAGTMAQELLTDNPDNELLIASQQQYEKAEKARTLESKLTYLSGPEKGLVLRGAEIFNQVCATCHGAEGRGTASMVAPPLAEQQRVNGDPEVLINILLKGLSGPIDGKNYPDVMPPQESNNDGWIAAVLSYIRNDLGNKAPVVKPEDVKKIRAKTATRSKFWTLKELER